MRIKINHFNLGLFNETCFVCDTKHEKYFNTVAEILEKDYSVKACVFVYDRDEMTDKVKRWLKYCYSVLFMLTPGVTEAAAKDENNLFRKVFAFTNKNNPYAVSLVAINGCMVDYGVEYPDDMKSFRWLHRKTFNIYQSTPNAIADEFYKEFRLHYNRRERKKLELLSTSGVAGYTHMYEKLSGLAKFAVICIVVAGIVGIIDIFYNLGFIERLCSIGACIAAFVTLAVIPVMWINLRDRVLDVSTVFREFKHRTRTRLTVCGCAVMFGISVGLFAGLIESINEKYEPQRELIMLGAYFILMSAVFAYILVMKRIAYDSSDYLELSKRRMKARLISLPIAVGVVGVEWIYFNIFCESISFK